MRVLVVLSSTMLFLAPSLSAQSAPPAKPAKPAATHGADHGAMHQEKPAAKSSARSATKPSEDHAASGWKELDAFHHHMMETWHPAKGKNDLAPLRAKSAEMAAAAKLLAASTAPKGCDTPALKTAAAGLAPASADLAVMVAQKATDAQLKTALSALHDKFEVLEQGCSPKSKHGAGHDRH